MDGPKKYMNQQAYPVKTTGQKSPSGFQFMDCKIRMDRPSLNHPIYLYKDGPRPGIPEKDLDGKNACAQRIIMQKPGE
jgi:hypothetical protein